MCLDIGIQSGSMNPKVDGVVYDLIGEINQWWETVDKTGKTIEQLEKEKLIKIANRRADYIDISWQESYRDRKVTIAEGYGEVYGSIMDTANKYNMGLEPAYIETIPNELMFTLEEDISNISPNNPVEITPALETTSYNLTVSARISDNDNNNVKLIVDASLSSDFTNSVTIESPMVNSGEIATVTIDGLDFNTINTRVYLKLKTSDGNSDSNIVNHNFYYRVKQPSNTQIYTVVSGDTLSDIAYRYKTTTIHLLELNPHVEANNIYVGQNIYVPIVKEEPIEEEPIGEPTVELPVEEEPVPEPEPVVIEEPLIFDEPVEDTRYYPQSMIFILDRTQNKIGVLNNDVPKALGYFNDVFTESIQSNLSTLEFEVQSNHDTANLLELEGFVIYTNPTNNKQHLFTIKEIEDIHSTTMIRRVFCESSATTELLSTIVRPVNMVSVTLEQALGIVLNQTGYSIGDIDFAGLRDINIETHTTALEALHRVVAEFGEMEFEVIFDGTQIKRKQVNVVRKRGKETGKIFEYTRNLTEIKKISDSNSVITALIGVGKDDANGKPLTFFTNEPRVLESQVVNPNLLSNAQSNPTNINFLQGWTVKGDVIESISSHIPANVDGVTNSLVITQTGVTDAERVNNFMCINTAENKTVIEPLKEYKFSVWLKSNADLMDGMSLSVVMEFYDSKMAQTGQFEKRFYVNADQWIKMELTGLAPANSKYANVEARVYYSITGETLHWTGAELRKLETAYTTGNQALTGLEEVEPRFVMINDYIADLEAFERYNKNGKHIFGVFIDDVSTNPIELYERTLKKLKELSTPKTTYECSVVSFEQLTGLDFYRVEVGDRVVVKDFEFSNNNPLLLNARVIEKKISFDPSNSKITLGNYSIAQVNENQGRILKQFQKVIMKKEAEWDSANVKAEEAIEKANESYEVAEVAQGTATEANEKAEKAITDTAQKLDKDIYTQEQNALIATIADKANFAYVDGMLVDKVNKGDVFTKNQVEETLLGYVSTLTFETNQ